MSALIVPFKEEYLKEVSEIFFESSSKKEFKSIADKEAFFDKYLGFYLKNFPEYCFVGIDKRVMGYVVASPESLNPKLLSLQPHMEIFKSAFSKYPAHLHINCHVESRGKGMGSALVKKIENELRSRKVIGLHIMTAPDSPNKRFYQRLGFSYEMELSFKGSLILLMGKNLSED